MIHLIAVLAVLALVVATLPGTCELALLTVGGILRPRHPLRQPARPPSVIARVAVVIPAHDEAGSIVRCVQSLLRCDPAKCETATTIVVVADNCMDLTAKLAESAGARVVERIDALRLGKGYALEDTFAMLLAEGFDAVIVIDADTVVEANLLVEVVTLLESGADGVQTRYGVLNYNISTRTRLMNIALMAFNVLRPRGRDRLGLSSGILGNGFALSRATLIAVPYAAHSIVEDLEYHLKLVRHDRRIEFADRTTVRADMPVSASGALTQRTRWEGGRIRMIVDHSTNLVAAIFHGNTKLLEPLLELLLLPLTFQVVLLLVTMLIPFRASRIYALGGLIVVGAHVLAGISVGGGGVKDLAALSAAPFYVVWKLMMSPSIVKMARHNRPWVRTER